MKRNFSLILISMVVAMLQLPAFGGTQLQQVWSLAANDRIYLSTGTNQRGLGYNPLTGHLILVNRLGGISVNILDAQNGNDLGALDVTGVTEPGTFLLSKVGVADDGVIYAANFGTIGTATPRFAVYRWSAEDTNVIATIAYTNDPGAGNIQQWGTTFAVRGAGTNTQILVTSSTGTIGALLTTADGTNFTSQVLQTDTLPGNLGISVAFGTNNTFWAKSVDGPLIDFSFNTNNGTATTLHIYDTTNFPGSVGPFMVNVTNNQLVAIDVTTPDSTLLYSISNLASAPLLLSATNLPSDNANTLFMGQVAFGGGLIYVLDSNNGLVAYTEAESSDPLPPYLILQPKPNTVFSGTTNALIVSATGTSPLHYQWQTNGVDIPNATNAILALTNIQVGQEADYSVTVTNLAGSVMSSIVHLTVLPPGVLTPLWSLAPGSRSYLTSTGNNQRGLAYNPVTGHVLVASMTSATAPAVNILDSITGADLGTLNVTGIGTNTGTFRLLVIGVADDGAIYAANFGTYSSTVTTTVYRWANESAMWTYAFKGDPTAGVQNRQWGNVIDVRGAGTNTQILLPSGNQQYVAILTTTNGTDFSSTLISNVPINSVFEGAAFGVGDTFWGKSSMGAALTHFGYDFTNFSATVLETYDSSLFPSTVMPIAVDARHNLLAGVSIATPDTINLYDISNPTNGPVLLQAVKAPTDNANGLFRGALDFGGEKLFALDTNNGLSAFALPFLAANRIGNNIVISWQSSLAGFTLESRPTIGSGTWTPVGGATLAGGRYSVSVPVSSASSQFYRLRK